MHLAVMEDVNGDKDFAFFLAMNETLELVMDHTELARNASDNQLLGIHLKMASRAMRCALEIYGSHIGVLNTEEQT